MKFRRDIEGLRFLAIVPILLFHAGFRFARAGFIGVDIFFVISGYLITSIILRELQDDHFSLTEFYRRRVARIMPAFAVVVIAVLILSQISFSIPAELNDVKQSALYSLLFVSNFYFSGSTDYFSSNSEILPLLHTWSLAIEEQFYIFFPAFIYLAHKYSRMNKRGLIAGITVFSLALSFLIGRYSTAIAFYQIPSRAWELGIGASVAAGICPRWRAPWMEQALAMLGAMLILAGLALITSGSAFPAPWALLPCIGAALLIAYGETGVTAYFLKLPPVRYIGRISFSLYLWHWPVMAFYRRQTGFHLDWLEAASLIALSIALASLTYVLVERPAQKWLRNMPTSHSLGFGGGAIATMALLCVLMPSPTASTAAARSAAYSGYGQTADAKIQFDKQCFVSNGNDVFPADKCLNVDPEERNILVIGDSHSAQYVTALRRKHPGMHVMQASASGCLPELPFKGEKRCTDVMRQAFQLAGRDMRIDKVVLMGRWRGDTREGLRKAVAFLRQKGRQVVIVGPVAEYDGNFPMLVARSLSSEHLRIDDFRVADRQILDSEMEKDAIREGVSYYSVYRRECDAATCRTSSPDGGPMHFDYGHVTLDAATYLIEGLRL